jgi:hypothetical protein
MEHDENEPPAVEGDDEEIAREAILSRRARFVAAALTSAGLAGAACSGSSDGSQPGVCLSIADSSAEGAQADGGAEDVGTDAADGADAGPQVCLSIE